MSIKNTPNQLAALSEAMVQTIEKAAASVVIVDARRRLPASGIAIKPDLVLTADHVVERHEDINIVLPDISRQNAQFVGHDPSHDLALLRLEDPLMVAAEIAQAEASTGQFVLALGRPSPDGIQASMGVISASGGPVHRHHGGMLVRHYRTDTIPYPGFSGGPLVDVAGKVLGLNTSGLVRGMSLTIPSDQALQIANQILEHGSVRRGYLGIRTHAVELAEAQRRVLTQDQHMGLLLVGVEKQSPAVKSGLQVGDILVGFAGKQIREQEELLSGLGSTAVGSEIDVEILRGDERITLKVIIGERA